MQPLAQTGQEQQQIEVNRQEKDTQLQVCLSDSDLLGTVNDGQQQNPGSHSNASAPATPQAQVPNCAQAKAPGASPASSRRGQAQPRQPPAPRRIRSLTSRSTRDESDLSADEKKQPSPTPVSDEKPPAGRVDSEKRRRSKTAESRTSRAVSRSRKTERSNTKSRHRSRSPLRRAKKSVGETQGAQPLAGKKLRGKKSQRRLKVQEPSLWREGEATLQNPSQGKFNTSTSETRLKRWTVQNPSLWREKISTTGRLKGSHAQCRSL